MKCNLDRIKTPFYRTIAMTLRLTLCVSLMVSGCGTETGNPIINRPKTPRLVAQDTVEAELQELTESVLDTGPIPPVPTIGSYLTSHLDSSKAQLLSELRNAPATNTDQNSLYLNPSLTCEGDKNRVLGAVDRKIEREKTLGATGAKVSVIRERKQSFLIESPLGALVCSPLLGVVFRFRLLEGTSETREGTSKVTIKRTGTQQGSQDKFAEFLTTGKRTRKHDRIVINADVQRAERTVEWSLNRTSRVTTANADSTDTSKSATVSGKAFKVLVVVSDDEGVTLKSKTIQSGTTLTTRSDGSQVELNFENLEFTQNECYPMGGNIRGTITPAANSDSPAETFNINFAEKSSETPQIVFASGDTIPLSGACID